MRLNVYADEEETFFGDANNERNYQSAIRDCHVQDIQFARGFLLLFAITWLVQEGMSLKMQVLHRTRINDKTHELFNQCTTVVDPNSQLLEQLVKIFKIFRLSLPIFRIGSRKYEIQNMVFNIGRNALRCAFSGAIKVISLRVSTLQHTSRIINNYYFLAHTGDAHTKVAHTK